MNKKFKVTYEYRGRVTVEIEAADEKEADTKGLAEADQSIVHNLYVYNTDVEEIG